jgi:putative holliday junction resolvase
VTTEARSGRVLGLDYGSRRVGVAVSDALRLTAHALEVVPRHLAVSRVAELVEELGINQIVVGLPTSLSGLEGSAAAAARDFAADIAATTGLDVVLIDERYSTVTAEKTMLAAGSKRRARRESLDKVAATIILQSFLDRPP